MRIAYVLSEEYSISPFNGVRIQAQTWADELVRKGHEMVYVNPWERQRWDRYDVVHIFGPVSFLRSFTRSLKTINKNQKIVYSPIIDTNQPIWKYKFISHLGCDKVRLYTHQFNVRKAIPFIDFWFVRSKYEQDYVNRAYGVPLERISIVPLSYRIPTISYYPQKERFCLHVSSIYKIDRYDNIEYLGKLSDEELIQQYKKAKVFALPSLYEGVGMVALEAAAYGCDIVITSLGGPKEYYSDKAFVVNPFSVEEIGKAVLSALESDSRQPALMNYVCNNYSLSYCVNLLLEGYGRAIERKV